MADRWRVIGGADKGGIVVREGRETTSQQSSERLGFGSILQEVELLGERLHFMKLEGSGPSSGWVSIRLKDKDLVQRVPMETGSPSQQRAPAKDLNEGEEWVVVHDRVVRRAGASKDSAMMAVEKKGAVVRGSVLEVAGVRWLKTLMSWKGESVDTFMMLDGTSIGLGTLLEKVRPAVAEGDFWVLQGTLFKKPGSDPETQKVSKMLRPVGSIVKTTGRLWTGPSGGKWVEVDAAVEKPGWLLVEGPGFEISGPLLEKAELGQESPLVCKLYSLITKADLCEVCLQRKQTIADVKRWIALRDPHALKVQKILVANEMPSDEEQGSFSIASFPTHKLYNDMVEVGQSRLKAGDRIPYFYMGEASDDGRFS